MQVWLEAGQVPNEVAPSVVTVGSFDGVHLGHRAVLAQTVAHARRNAARAVAVTFHPHPVQVLRPDLGLEQLTGQADQHRLLADSGLDGVLDLEFTRELASMSATDFIADVLVGALGVIAVVVGADVRFGAGREGDLRLLRSVGERLGFAVIVPENVLGATIDGESRRWSSSWTRELLAVGDVAGAAKVLGRPHRVTGIVVHGDHRGRELGFPTANLGPDSTGMVPADGVYAGWLLRPGVGDENPDRFLPAAISIGTNPTFGGCSRRVEAYVLDRSDLDLYGERVAVELVDRLRPTLTFESVDALVEQMHADVVECRRVLSRPVPDC